MKLKINANDTEGAAGIQVRYRVADSGQTFAVSQVSSVPYYIEDVAPGYYEVGVRKKSASGKWSEWATGFSQVCAVPEQFTAARSSNNFQVYYAINGDQSRFQVQLTDPNGGTSVKTFSVEGTGQVAIPIVPFIVGSWVLRMRSVCDQEASPKYVSEWSDNVEVEIV